MRMIATAMAASRHESCGRGSAAVGAGARGERELARSRAVRRRRMASASATGSFRGHDGDGRQHFGDEQIDRSNFRLDDVKRMAGLQHGGAAEQSGSAPGTQKMN